MAEALPAITAQAGYDAFISYRRSDGRAVAQWLRRELEAFVAPRPLALQFGRRLRVYLDTAYERGAVDFYEQNIRPALLGSRYLIVIATPDATRRRSGGTDWIEREVGDFVAGPNATNVLIARGAGNFSGPLPAALDERFPNVEIVDLRGAARLAFLNPLHAARLASEKLKIVAPLLELPSDHMPALRQEQERREQARLGAVSGAVVGVLLAVAGLSAYALQSRNQAVRALDDSVYAAGALALQATGLPRDDSRAGDVRRYIVSSACDLQDKFLAAGTDQAGVEALVICRLERAADYEEVDEKAEARREISAAVALAERHYREHHAPDAAEALIRARQVEVETILRWKEEQAAEASLAKLDEAARMLADDKALTETSLRRQASAHELLAVSLAERDRPRCASHYDAAAAAVEGIQQLRHKGLLSQSGHPTTEREDQAWLFQLYSQSAVALAAAGDLDAALVRLRRAIEAHNPNKDAPLAPQYEFELAMANWSISLLEQQKGNAGAAGQARQTALSGLDRVVRSPAASPELRTKVSKFLSEGTSLAVPASPR